MRPFEEQAADVLARCERGYEGDEPHKIDVIAGALRAAEAKARREAHHAGWDDFRDTVKPLIFAARKPFEIMDALEILNRHHYAHYGRALSPAPQNTDAPPEQK